MPLNNLGRLGKAGLLFFFSYLLPSSIALGAAVYVRFTNNGQTPVCLRVEADTCWPTSCHVDLGNLSKTHRMTSFIPQAGTLVGPGESTGWVDVMAQLKGPAG